MSQPRHASQADAPLLRITAPHFVAGVVPGLYAAPIVAYMIAWAPAAIECYCADKGWSVERLNAPGEYRDEPFHP